MLFFCFLQFSSELQLRQFQQFSLELEVPAILNLDSSRLELYRCVNFQKVSVVSERCFRGVLHVFCAFQREKHFLMLFLFLTAEIFVKKAKIYWSTQRITDWIVSISL